MLTTESTSSTLMAHADVYGEASDPPPTPKRMIRSEKIRASANGETCTMGSPRCNGDSATTVWCHSNHSEHGKGYGLKAHDVMGFYGCSGCHQWYDFESRSWDADDRKMYFYRAWSASLLRLVEKGLIEVAA